MIDLLKLSQKHGHEKFQKAVESALSSNCYDSAAVQHLLNAEDLTRSVRSHRRRCVGAIRTTHAGHA